MKVMTRICYIMDTGYLEKLDIMNDTELITTELGFFSNIYFLFISFLYFLSCYISYIHSCLLLLLCFLCIFLSVE